MKCKNIQNHLLAYLEAVLSEKEKACVESHLANCTACQEELKCVEKEAKILSSMPRVAVPVSFADGVAQRAEREVYSKGFFEKWFNPDIMFPKIRFVMAVILGAVVVTGLYQYGMKEKDMIKDGSSSMMSYFAVIPNTMSNLVTGIFSNKNTYDVEMSFAVIVEKTSGKITEYEALTGKITFMVKIPTQNYDMFMQNMKSEYPLSNVEIINKDRRRISLLVIINT